MWGYVIISVVIILAAAAAVALIAITQAKRRRRGFRLEITNFGNVRSRYELGAEDAEKALQFRFELDGDPLPARQLSVAAEVVGTKASVPPSPSRPAEDAGLAKKGAQASGAVGSAAEGLGSLGDILPGPIRAPLDRLLGRMRSGQVKVQRVRQTTGRVQRAKSLAKSKVKKQPQTAVTTLPSEVETPFVKPGETLILDLWVRAGRPGLIRAHPFVVRSRSVEQKDAPWVTEESLIQLLASAGLSRYLPYLIVLFGTAALLALVVWLASGGTLG